MAYKVSGGREKERCLRTIKAAKDRDYEAKTKQNKKEGNNLAISTRDPSNVQAQFLLVRDARPRGG
jgi:hypothetical protein